MSTDDDTVIMRSEVARLTVEVPKMVKPWHRLGPAKLKITTRELVVTTRSLDDLQVLEQLLSGIDAKLRQEQNGRGLDMAGHATLIMREPCGGLPAEAVSWIIDQHYRINYPKRTAAMAKTQQAAETDTPPAPSPSTEASSVVSSAGPSTSASPTSAV